MHQVLRSVTDITEWDITPGNAFVIVFGVNISGIYLYLNFESIRCGAY